MNASPTITAPQIIAIVGGTGAGKGWMARRLCNLFGEHAGQLSLDDFYRDRSHLPPARRSRLNFDIPRAIDWPRARQTLRTCRTGQAAAVPCYDFQTHTRLPSEKQVEAKPILIVEGLWLLWRPSTRRLFSLKLFLDCPAPLRLSRRRARDVVERGRTAEAVEHSFRAIAPFHERYVEPQRRWADLVLGQPFDTDALSRLAASLWPVARDSGRFPAWTPEAFRTALLSQLTSNDERTH